LADPIIIHIRRFFGPFRILPFLGIRLVPALFTLKVNVLEGFLLPFAIVLRVGDFDFWGRQDPIGE
jgi:hypothetical protein